MSLILKHFKPVLLIYHGPQNNGKTTVLNLLIKALEHECSMLYYRKQGSEYGKDRQAVALLEGYLIGVGTAGDSHAAVRKNCDFFEIERCAVGVTASHEDSATLSKDPKIASILARYTVLDFPAGKAGVDVQNMYALFNAIKNAISSCGNSAAVKRYDKKNPWLISAW